MAGRTRKFNPVLSEQDKATLEKIVSSRTEEIRKVQRAKMILLAASGSSNTDIRSSRHGLFLWPAASQENFLTDRH